MIADPGDEFETISIATDHLVALVPEDSALAGYEILSQSDLAAEPFIMTLGGSENYVLNWFNQASIDPKITHRVLQAHSILELVRAGLGNAIVASLSLPEIITGVHQLPLFESTPNRLVLVRKYQTPYSKAAELFWTYMFNTVR